MGGGKVGRDGIGIWRLARDRYAGDYDRNLWKL